MELTRFDLGRTVITSAALAALEEAGVPPIVLIAKHGRGDWGDILSDDIYANEQAVAHGDSE